MDWLFGLGFLLLILTLYVGTWFVMDVWLDSYAAPDSVSWWLKPAAIFVRNVLGIHAPGDRGRTEPDAHEQPPT